MGHNRPKPYSRPSRDSGNGPPYARRGYYSRSVTPTRPWAAPFLILAVLLHLLAGQGIAILSPLFANNDDGESKPMSLVILEPPPPPVEPDPEPEEIYPDGQLVELAPTEDPVEPEDADYLASQDQTAITETRADRFKVNPDVLARAFSQKSQASSQTVPDLNMKEESSGAIQGNERFIPDRDGAISGLPSPWRYTNLYGMENPTTASELESALTGAPQNDLLNEKLGKEVHLNAKKYLYEGYLNRIRRLVNFYWQQNIDNLPRSVRFAKSRYLTGTSVILDSDGSLEMIAVTSNSGSSELDDCVVRAFRLAGPFPNPPEGLLEKDGRAYLPPMEWNVHLGAARARYTGIDPRAGVQYPGILKSPR